jgi:hypothetical protein
VLEVISPHAYCIDLPASMKIHNVFHVSLQHPTASDPLPGQRHHPLPPVVIEEEEEYQVGEISDGCLHQSHLQFLVSWAGYKTLTWGPLSLVQDTVAIDWFTKHHPDMPQPPPESKSLPRGEPF